MPNHNAPGLTESSEPRYLAEVAAQNISLFVDHEVITLTRNGLWLTNGQEIEHEATLKLFPKILRRDEQGYFLQLGRESKRITVEDTPYFVTSLEGSAQSGFELILNDESREALDPPTLTYKPGRLACRVKRGAFEAKFLHGAYFRLLESLEEDGSSYFVVIESRRVMLSSK